MTFPWNKHGVLPATGRTPPLGERAHSIRRSFCLRLASFILAISSPGLHFSTPAAATTLPPVCCGDCDDDGQVSVDDLVTAVGIALGRLPLTRCAAANLDAGAMLTVDELVMAVHSAIAGCPDVWRFRDVTTAAGIDYRYGYYGSKGDSFSSIDLVGGVAAGDFDADGWVDLYTLGGEVFPNRLYRNRGDGTFEDIAPQSGVALILRRHSGATFADFDGDGRLDLFVGGVEGTTMRMFRNEGARFADFTATSGVSLPTETFSAAFGDHDRDGDLDTFIGQWGTMLPVENVAQHFWINDGSGSFRSASVDSGLSNIGRTDNFNVFRISWVFTPNFADINNDGWPDLLLTSDYETSQVFLNNGDGTFYEATTDTISDQNGMGAAIGDYDNDGDLDWFVSSIYGVPDEHGVIQLNGNRLYRNRGDGRFDDVTDDAGVRDGGWGWAACFQDFNNDGHLDIFHVNGYGYLDNLPFGRLDPQWDEYHADAARLFVADGHGSFRERATELGVGDTGQGRGVVCFDYDGDGDIDVFISNNGQPPRLYRNDGGNRLHYLQVKLVGRRPNSEAIGARIYVTSGGMTQLREVRAGSNYLSQDPTLAHFGLAAGTRVERLRVLWPDDQETILEEIDADQLLTITQDPA